MWSTQLNQYFRLLTDLLSVQEQNILQTTLPYYFLAEAFPV